ncbi:hypothetical protein H4P12_10795 [Paracoccus sp. 11-3]|uniref:Uncharacterized protein n=1 Tax=Paracoccus amoyensis TaxID=2760093 RepID=A0A926GNP5_9RHOB|nr:hypothetical protein [Paracoccus amoyensis]
MSVTPPPPKQYARAKLDTVWDVRKELAKLYREAHRNDIDVGDASRLAKILVMMARIMADSEFEVRIEALEQRGRH